MNLNLENYNIESLKELLAEVQGYKDTLIELKAPAEHISDLDERLFAIRQAINSFGQQKKEVATEGHGIPKLLKTAIMPIVATQRGISSSGSYKEYEKEKSNYFPSAKDRRRHQQLERSLQASVKQFLLLTNKEPLKGKYKILIEKRLYILKKYIADNAKPEYKKELLDRELSCWVKDAKRIPLTDKLFTIIGLN